MLHCLLANDADALGDAAGVFSLAAGEITQLAQDVVGLAQSLQKGRRHIGDAGRRWRRQMLAVTPRPADYPADQHHGAAADEDLDGI